MRNTLKIFAAVLCLTAFSTNTTLQAQDTGRNGERQNELFEKLDLSEDQKVKFTEIQTQYRAEISELRSQGRNQGNREKIQTLNSQKDAEVKSILTEEQYAIYETSRKEGRRSKSGGRTRS